MNIASWTLLCVLSTCFEEGYGILCYHCHQTTSECNNGVTDSIHQKNCQEERCAVMKYETIMPGRKVLATSRDCAVYSEQEFVHMVSPNKSNPARIVFFQECSTPLCNLSSRKNNCSSLGIIVLLSMYLFS